MALNKCSAAKNDTYLESVLWEPKKGTDYLLFDLWWKLRYATVTQFFSIPCASTSDQESSFNTRLGVSNRQIVVGKFRNTDFVRDEYQYYVSINNLLKQHLNSFWKIKTFSLVFSACHI
jgi:hypothetical protein